MLQNKQKVSGVFHEIKPNDKSYHIHVSFIDICSEWEDAVFYADGVEVHVSLGL